MRELKNAVERCVYRTDEADKPIARILFDPFASPYAPAPAPFPAREEALEATSEQVSEQEIPGDFRSAVAAFEQRVLRRALERAQFKQTTAAKLLGLSYHQLRSLLRKHALAKSANGDADLE